MGFQFTPGSVLLSHTVASVVPSALEGLTSVFGMGTGVAPPLLPPEKSISTNDMYLDKIFYMVKRSTD